MLKEFAFKINGVQWHASSAPIVGAIFVPIPSTLLSERTEPLVQAKMYYFSWTNEILQMHDNEIFGKCNNFPTGTDQQG